MRVLITGGAGFIGSHLAHRHLLAGDEVVIVDDFSTGSQRNVVAIQEAAPIGSLTVHRAQVEAWPRLSAEAAAAQRVYHLAAAVGVFRVLEDPVAVLESNLTGTLSVLRAVADAPTPPVLLVASSSEVYGPENTAELTETDPLVVPTTASIRWTYAITKLADESIALSFAASRQLPVVVVRLFNTIGPRQAGRYGMVAPRFAAQAVANKPLTIYGDGSQRRCFCDVRDTVRALDLLASAPEAQGEIVNVGAAREISVEDLARQFRERAESSSRFEFLPHDVAYGVEFREFSVRRPDLQKLRRLTGFEPEIPLEQTIDDLLEFASSRKIEQPALSSR